MKLRFWEFGFFGALLGSRKVIICLVAAEVQPQQQQQRWEQLTIQSTNLCCSSNPPLFPTFNPILRPVSRLKEGCRQRWGVSCCLGEMGCSYGGGGAGVNRALENWGEGGGL